MPGSRALDTHPGGDPRKGIKGPAPAAAACLAWVCGAGVTGLGRWAQSERASRPTLPGISPAEQMEDRESPAPSPPAPAAKAM